MRQTKIKLILASFLSLFLELSLIRWCPAHIFSIAFFSNIILIASFLGLGLGLLFSDNKRDLFNLFPFLLAGYVFLVLLLNYIQVELPADAQTWIWSYYYKNNLLYHNIYSFKISITQLIGLTFILTAGIFIPIGQKIGKLIKEFHPLYGYSVNIFGSLIGIFAFSILALFRSPAYTWFLLAGIVIIFIDHKEKGIVLKSLFIVAIIVTVGFAERDILWSPYYAVKLRNTGGESFAVYINNFFHQKAIDFKRELPAYDKYMLAYKWFQPKRVLIIGSGTGNDVWVAREAGVDHIDAVEIDPLILELGYRKHPQRPYDSEKVKVFIDDARSFIHHASEKYDMVVYGTLDSHATLCVTSSIRLDNYVYTQEALQETRRLLRPGGVVVLLFSVPTDWMKNRLLETVRDVFGSENTRYLILGPRLFNLMIVAGPGIRQAILTNPDLSNILLPLPARMNITLPKDDWPYLYLTHPAIPHLYGAALILLICLSAVLIFIFSPLRGGKIDPLFFLLGCAFLLLETKSVTTLSLLFGSTWLVNAIVFSSILAIALLSNWLVMAKRLVNPLWSFGGLILSLVFVYFLPFSSLLEFNFFVKILLAGILVALPIFFSSVIFAIIIQSTKDIGISLGSNLLGAVVGGFLEYLSMLWGLRALYIIALGCYIIAVFLLCSRRRQ